VSPIARTTRSARTACRSRLRAHALLLVECIVVSVASFACGAADSDSAPTPTPTPTPTVPECLPPNRVLDDRCLEPGVQDSGCPAGTLTLQDGACQPAGVPPELCADGFEPDGAMGCAPILPDEPCAAGQMAVPGETECHPVMPCGAGKWGDIPIDATTVHVDGSYSGNDSDGTAAKPWTTVGEGIAAAPPDALVAIAAGSYLEDVVVEKPVRLRGVCPSEVEVVGTDAGYAALFFRPGSTGSEVRGLALTGDKLGILVVGAENIAIEQVWVHDALRHGVSFEDALGPTSGTLRASLLELNHVLGVMVRGSVVTIEGVVVRGTMPGTTQDNGNGIYTDANVDTLAPATALVRNSVVEHNHEVGVSIGSDATLEGLVVRGTLPRVSDQQGGRGIHIQETGAPITALVRSSLVEQNHDVGVAVAGANATLQGVVVRGTLPRATDNGAGWGILVDIDPYTGAPAAALVESSLVENNRDIGVLIASNATFDGLLVRGTLPQASDETGGSGIVMQPYQDTPPDSGVVRGSVVEGNQQAGVVVSGFDATLEGVVVRGTLPRAADQRAGYGIAIQPNPFTGALSTAIVRSSLVEQNHETGVSVNGSATTLEGMVVRDTLPGAADQAHGWGIAIQRSDTGAPTAAVVRSSLVENNRVFGVMVQGADATLDGLLVRNTLPLASDGSFGDGVVVVSLVLASGPAEASAVVTNTRIEKSARAGLASFGSHVTLGGSAMSCNAFDLDGEELDGFQFSFEDLGGNDCGCPEPLETCVAQSSSLQPPEPLANTL
jgi:hypothetical protein